LAVQKVHRQKTRKRLACIVLRRITPHRTNPSATHMAKPHLLLSALGAILVGPIAAYAQAPAAPPAPRPVPVAPAPIDPPIIDPAVPTAPAGGTLQVAPAATAPGAIAPVTSATNVAPMESSSESPDVARVFEFQGEELGLVLRTLARAAKMNIMVSDKVQGTVQVRLENKTPREAIRKIVEHKGLVMEEKDGDFSIKTPEEKAKEPTEPASYTFSYATAKDIMPLLNKQLVSKDPSDVDPRTNTIFFKETKSNMERILLFLTTIDRPTEQVMIEARLVEVTANPKQAYGLNWGGVVGSSSNAQTFKYGGSPLTGTSGVTPPIPISGNGQLQGTDFLFKGAPSNALAALGGQFAILSAPQMSVTLRLLNEDSDAEFLANPRVVTSNNQKAEIKITRNQPVPKLNFNEQTAQAVFSGFEDKEFGNKLVVTPVINKDNFVTLNVKPEISNKVGDATFTFSGATVTSPIIDKRELDSNVLIKSGDTLAIGGLLQDESTKQRTKVPVLGDLPIIGAAFTERINTRTKRNLLVFVTPTIIEQGYGTGLESQVSGLTHGGDVYADPNGWRNNAKGSIRLVPTSNRSVAADIAKPGVAPSPKKRGVRTVAVKVEEK
jgi:type IV pilus secretin PilQ/predicted competence protein